MGFSYNGLGTTDLGSLDFSLGSTAPMAPVSNGFSMGTPAPSTSGPTVQSATQAATAAAPAAGATASTAAGAATPAPIRNPVTGELENPGFWQKGGGFSIALGALQTLGNLWNSFQQVKLAKDSLNFQKQAYQTNLASTTKDYNTRLANDATVSGQMSGWSQEKTDQYIKEHSL